jgi:DNA-binding transcriptional ArsR family regulator
MGRPMLVQGDVFRAIADPTRRMLLDRLSEGEQSVSVLASSFSMTLPAVSQHLKILKDVGLVSDRAEGRQRMYQMHAEPLRDVFDWVSHYEKFWRKKMSALGAYLDKEDH